MTTWQQQFPAGWSKLLTGQRFERAKYIVEEGLSKGHNAVEISDSLAESPYPVSPQAIRDLVDLYAVGTGVAAAAESSGRPRLFSSGERRLTAAWENYGKRVKVTDGDLAKVRREFPKAEQPMVTRIATGRAIGGELVDDGKIEQDEDGFHLTTPDPRSVQKIKDEHGTPVSYDEWRSRFGVYATTCRAFLTFLRRTKDNMMQDESLGVQLQNMTDGFQEQADRFDVGVAKAQARS